MTPIQTEGWQLHPGANSVDGPDGPGGADAHALLGEGGSLQLVFLSATAARVTWRPADGFRQPRTWSIAPAGDTPWQGRPRASLEGFDRPRVTAADAQTQTQTLVGGRLAAQLLGGAGSPVRIVWSDTLTGQTVMQDRVTSAYLSERRTGLIRHSLVRDPRERYYGLGDKTGPLNRAGPVAGHLLRHAVDLRVRSRV
jgi:alpha-glucosidase